MSKSSRMTINHRVVSSAAQATGVNPINRSTPPKIFKELYDEEFEARRRYYALKLV